MATRRTRTIRSDQALPGRQRDREIFADALGEAIQGSPRLLLYEGESGSGKSSLLQEIADSPLLPRRRIRVAHIEIAKDDPVDPVAAAARDISHLRLYDRVGGRRRFLRTARKVLPDWIGAIPGWGDLVEAIARTIDVAARRRHAKLGRRETDEDIEAVLRTARTRPAALIFDNMDLLSPRAVERFRALIDQAETGTRLLIIGGVRTPPPGAPAPPVATLPDRLPPGRVIRRRLPPLALADIEEWFGHRLPGAALPAAFASWLQQETGGQPGALEATVSALIEHGALSADHGVWRLDEDHPALRAPVAAGPDVDLSRLGPAAADTVRAASLLGDDFDSTAVSWLTQADELDVEDHLAVAARAGIVESAGIVEGPDGDIATLYRFLSTATRAALTRTLSGERRRELESRLEIARSRGQPPDA